MTAIKKHWLKHAPTTIKEIKGGSVDDYLMNIPMPRIECTSGFSIFVQAGHGFYCKPQITDKTCPYTHWECAYPSLEEPLLMDFAENPIYPTMTIYGYVPTEIIEQVIEKHGGIKE